MVKASGKKPFKQKGTGNARAGTRTSPIWRGGGVIFGPSPKDWSFSVPKKIKKLALNNALVYKLKEKSVHLVDSFELKDNKTKNLSTSIPFGPYLIIGTVVYITFGNQIKLLLFNN